MNDATREFSPRQKIAVLMIALGEEATAEIMKYLGDDDGENIAQALAELDTVSTDEMDAVIEEFEKLLRAGAGMDEGGGEFARSVLEKTVGAEKADQMLSRVEGKKARSFSSLDHIAPHELVAIVAKEHPQTIAVILSQLEPGVAAEVFNELSIEMQTDIANRMARVDRISPQALDELERTLSDELKTFVSERVTQVPGVDVVSEMLDNAGRTTETRILDDIDTKDPELAEQIRNRMYTFDSLVGMSQKHIQLVLRAIEQEDLALALRGASEEAKEVVFASMSERASSALKEDMEFQGQSRMSEVEQAQVKISQVIRELGSHGEVTVARGPAEDFI